MRFSERIGKKKIKVEIQINSMDDELRNGLWNVVCMFITEPMKENQWISGSPFEIFINTIWFSFFKEPIDEIRDDILNIIKNLRNRFYSWNYLEVYDFIEFVASTNAPFNNNKFVNTCNVILKKELSGFRFVNKKLVPITNENEIKEIENAISTTDTDKLKGVNIHLKEALNKISNKENPDYRNSIKESISAVESLCQYITNDPKVELGKALKVLKGKLPIHSALVQGFIKLYGYTSDGDGIRHALMDDTTLDQEDALYMLISCSAFVNYLITKSKKAGLELL